MQDMELRQSYVREANINEGTTLRAAWCASRPLLHGPLLHGP
jgi:hypothetical protein